MEYITISLSFLILAAIIAGIIFLRRTQHISPDDAATKIDERLQAERRMTEMMDNLARRHEEALRRQTDQLNRQYETRLEAMQTRHEQQMAALQSRHDQQLAAMKAEYDRQRAEAEQKTRREADDLRRESTAQFKALAAEILKSQTDGLKEQNVEQIEALLKPLAENLEGFRKAVTDSYVQENASRQSLTDQIDRLMKLNESIGAEARNLTTALKGNSKVQGDWGEMILETMLENAGLERGIHFDVQLTRDVGGNQLKDEDGRRQRPDVVVNLPDSRKLIIDSKVSLTAFADYCAEEDGKRKEQLLHAHIASVRRHIDELAGKKYQNTLSGSADHVMMFIPNEGAYLLAVKEDSELWQYAYNRHVALVSPTHLFSSMRIVSQLWIQDKQNRNTLDIARKGGALYDKVMLFLGAMQDLGNTLDKARDTYDTALSRLTTGRGSVTRLSEDMKKLGAKATKTMPASIVKRLETDENQLISENAEPRT